MTDLAKSLDNIYNPIVTRKGENNSIEYGWNNSYSYTDLAQIYFQLTRESESESESESEGTRDNKRVVCDVLNKYYTYLKHKIETNNIYEIDQCYKLIAQTRDIVNGKGLYMMSYKLLEIWVKLAYIENVIDPVNIKNALNCFVSLKQDNISIHPYGSWKDLKYFANYLVVEKKLIDKNHPLIHYISEMYAKQIQIDSIKNSQNGESLSLVGKWAPRENSKFKWLALLIATKYSNLVNDSLLSKKQRLIQYRHAISNLNKLLDTTQIKQCSQNWAMINFNNVTSITMNKQTLAFNYVYKNGNIRGNNQDRIQCAENLKTFVNEIKNSNKTINGKNVEISNMVKNAFFYCMNDFKLEKEILESQWKSNSKQNENLGEFIPMIDTSGSMEGLPLYSAIGLGIRCSEKSIIKDRVLTFSHNPKWVDLSSCNDSFIEKVNKIKHSSWGINTDFQRAYKMILHALIEKNVKPEKIKNLTLIVFSDMQFDQAVESGEDGNMGTMFDIMKNEFKKFNYELPKIVFWNLKQTNGFPTLTNTKNVMMVSGNSPALLNIFTEKGLDGLKNINPNSLLKNILQHERYNHMKYINIM